MTKPNNIASEFPPGFFYRTIEKLGNSGMSVAGWAYLSIAALVCFDIISRRFLGFSSGATTEITGYLLGIGMTMGMAGTLFDRGHVRIDVLVQRLPLKLRVVFHGVSLLALLVATGFLAWGAIKLALDSYDMGAADMSAAHLPLVIPQGIWAAGLILMTLAVLAVSARALRMSMAGRPEQADEFLLPRSDIDEAEETLEALGRHDEAVKLAASLKHAETQGESK